MDNADVQDLCAEGIHIRLALEEFGEHLIVPAEWRRL